MVVGVKCVTQTPENSRLSAIIGPNFEVVVETSEANGNLMGQARGDPAAIGTEASRIHNQRLTQFILFTDPELEGDPDIVTDPDDFPGGSYWANEDKERFVTEGGTATYLASGSDSKVTWKWNGFHFIATVEAQ